jgi:microcystin-dependent protein
MEPLRGGDAGFAPFHWTACDGTVIELTVVADVLESVWL